MNASEYRAEYALFSRDLEQERARLFAAGIGDEATRDHRRTAERYGYLHTPAAIADLAAAIQATSADFETERAGLRRLAGRACLHYALSRAEEIDFELRDALASRAVRFEGAGVPLAAVPARLASEPRAASRSDLAARWLDELPACDDLLCARAERLDAAATELGFADYAALRRDAEAEATASDDRLAELARVYLARTNDAYRRRFLPRTASALPGADASRPVYADSLRFELLPQADARFPASELAATCRAALASLRLPDEGRVRSRFDLAPPDGAARRPRAAAFGIDPPSHVELGAHAASGFVAYRDALLALGRAQHLAWSSADLRRRNPEFVCPAGDDGGEDRSIDDPTRRAHAESLAALLCDPAWLADHRGLRPEDARPLARAAGFVSVFRARRAAARLVARPRAVSELTDADAHGYAALMTDATGFLYDPRLYLTDVLGGGDASIELRASAFAAGLHDLLRTRHGSRWWSRAAARDELIDIWNTGTRYAPEELLSLIGGAPPDAETLADAHLDLLRDDEDA